MVDEDDSEFSDVDPEEIARLVQDVDDLDADMFGLKVTKPKGKTVKSSGSAVKSSPTPKTAEAMSGKSRLLAEMFPARSDWLGLQDEPKEVTIPNTAPISPLASRRSRDTAPIVASTGKQSPTALPTERPKFTPTPRRARSGPPDPLGLFQGPQEGVSDLARPDPALPSWLGGAQTPILSQESSVRSPSPSKTVQEQRSSSLELHKPFSNSLEQIRLSSNLVEQQTIPQNSLDVQIQSNYSPNQAKNVTKDLDQNNTPNFFKDPPRDASNALGKTELSNIFQSLPQQPSNEMVKHASHNSPQQSSNVPDQPQLFTNFHFEPKNIQEHLIKNKSVQSQPNDMPTVPKQQSLVHAINASQSSSMQERHEATSSVQQEGFRKPTTNRHTADLETQRDDSRSPSPRQQPQSHRENRSDRDYRDNFNNRSADPHSDHDDYRRDRERDSRLILESRQDRESRLERDLRLERLLETLISRSAADAQLDGQRMRRELDALAASLRDEMAALAGSRRREALAQEAAQEDQRDVARGMDALGSQLKGLAEALAEHRQCWQRDTAALQAALAQRSEPAPAQQGPVNQRSLSNGQTELQEKSADHQRDTLSLHASQAYFAQDVKQEIRAAFKELQQEVSTVGKLSKQAQQEFVEKVERERALFADEMKQSRDLLLWEIKRQEEAIVERFNSERASFSEDMRRQRSDFAKEMEWARQESFEEMRKELDAFTGTVRKERANFNQDLKQERATFLAKLLEEREALTAHTSIEAARFSERLAQSSTALAAEMRRERDALAAREAALAEREVAVRWRNESLATAARELQKMAAAAVDAREQGNAALTAAERIEGRECARAAELSTQLAQLRDVERARVARRLAQARQHARTDVDLAPATATKISLMRMQAQHNFTMVEADSQLFESLCSVSK